MTETLRLRASSSRAEMPATNWRPSARSMAASLDGGSRDPVILLLEWPSGMDEDVRSAVLHKAPELAAVGIEQQRLAGAETELPGGFHGTVAVTASYQHSDGRISGKACANAMSEKSVAAQNQNRIQPDPSRVSVRSQGGR
jgi:hypothetical protein